MFEGIKVLRNARMSEYTTLKLGGPADYLAFPASVKEMRQLILEAQANDMAVTVVGHGSNLLVRDGGIRGLVICMGKAFAEVRTEGNTVIAQAGAMMAKVAAAAAEAGLTGVEFISGIPGTVGGGILMNAGAYGGEMSQCVTEVKALRLTDGEEFVYPAEELRFAYRHSALQEQPLLVTEVTFCLKTGKRETILETMAALNARRAEKQPLSAHSAGSTFKRPEGYFAGALIEGCGLKGKRIGGAEVSMKHAGFLTNDGGTAKDFLDLIDFVQETVLKATGVFLEPEVRIIGEEESKCGMYC